MPGEIRIVMSGDAKELDDLIAKTFGSKADLEEAVKTTTTESKATIEEVKQQTKEMERNTELAAVGARLTIRNTLFALRTLTDIMSLYNAITGENVKVQALSMVSMGLTAVLQLKLMAAIYAATPGMQPIAMTLLSLIPIITGFIIFVKSEQARVLDLIHKANEQQLDEILDGVDFSF